MHKPGYRLYVIHKLPQLRVLDFKRIRLKVSEYAPSPSSVRPILTAPCLIQEREKAKEVFGGRKGEEKAKALAKKAKTYVYSSVIP